MITRGDINDDPDIGGIPVAEKGAANGVCPLDGSAKVDPVYLPVSITGAIFYNGPWDASTGAYPVTPSQGDYYVVSVEGTISGVLYKVKDWMICQSIGPDVWDQIDAQDLNIPMRGFATGLSNNPPGAPSDGDIWMIGSIPTGVWVGNANNVGTWNATAAAWTYQSSVTGWTYWSINETNFYTFNVAWVLHWTLASHDNLQGRTENNHHNRLHDLDGVSDHNGVSGATVNELMKYDANGLPAISLMKHYHEIREVPNTGFDYIEIGNFTQTEGSFALWISVANEEGGGDSGADMYIIVGDYNQTTGAWELAWPIVSREPHSQLVVNINNDVLSLRLIAITSTPGTLTTHVHMIDVGVGDAVFAATSGTGTMGLPGTNFDTAILMQLTGEVHVHGELDMNSNQITEVTDPSSAQHVDTQNARDAAITTHTGVAGAHHAKYLDSEAQTAVKYQADVNLAGVAPVYADLTGAGWSDGDRGMGVGTGGRIFFMQRVGVTVKYVELT